MSVENPMTKAECLAHYCLKEPTGFQQYDGFVKSWNDSVIKGDEDGDALMAGYTFELMSGVPLRVLIPESTTAIEAVRLLHKIADSIEAQGFWAPTPGTKVELDDLPF